MTFYVSKNGQRLGPYSVEQIKIFIHNGLVTFDSLVWTEGWNNWVPIQEVGEFAADFQRSSPIRVATIAASSNPDPAEASSAYVQGKEPVIACILSLVIVGSGH